MEEEITIDLRELAHIVQKNARFIAKVTGGCIVAAGLYLLIASPVYESDSLLRIKQPKGDRLVAFRKYAYGQCHGQQTADEHLCGNLKKPQRHRPGH